MKKLYLLSAFLIFACSTDSEGNPCIYEPTLTTEAVTNITETSATLNGTVGVALENRFIPKFQIAKGHSSINVSLTYLRGLEPPELTESDMPMV